MSKEIWKDIPGYEGEFQASSLGRIRSLDRWKYQTDYRGEYKRYLKGKILKPRSKPYSNVGLTNGEDRHIHDLIMLTFIGSKPINMQVNHKDGNKRNNKLENLEYVTLSGNALHARRTGLNTYKPTKETINKMVAASIAWRKEHPKAHSNTMKKLWSNPEFRAKMLIIRKAQRKRRSNVSL